MLKCHACGTPLDQTRCHRSFSFVASDCQPVSVNLLHCVCSACGLVQKEISREWQAACEGIYASYQIYHQAGGAEQKVRHIKNGTLVARSQMLTDTLRLHATLNSTGTVIDIGCGNGAFLRAFHEQLPHWSLVGVELNETFQQDIEGITPSARFLPAHSLDSETQQFDIVSLIHCLEHIPSPVDYLSQMRRYMDYNSLIFIQVPDAELNPFDLVIADHASHFSKQALARTVARAGFDVIACDNIAIDKEITCIAKLRDTSAPSLPDIDTASAFNVELQISWIDAVRQQALQLAASHDNFGIFGSSIAASWLAGACGDRLRFFVDEDPERIGRRHLGRQILAPQDVPNDAVVLVALAPATAAKVAAKLAGMQYAIMLPPSI